MRAYLEAARENRKLQRIALTVAVFAAVFVVLGVFWALKNTGIAMTGDPTCGFVDHAHADACYEKTLKCGQEELEAHTHSIANGCYAVSSTPAPAAKDAAASSAAQASSAASKDKASAAAQGEKPQSEKPQAQASAQAAEQAKSSAAASGAAQGASAQPAAQSTQPAQSTQTLVCEKPETPGHTHTDACYEKTLTCTTPEHTHSQSCYDNADADVETAKDWEATLPSNLTGDWSKDVVAVAQSQLDYTESQLNRVAGANGDPQGYTRYGAWADTPYADWSAPFAAFCLHYAKADGYPVEMTCPEWAKKLQGNEYGLYHPVEGGYEPKPGDLVFLGSDKDAEKVATARTQAAEALAQVQAQAQAQADAAAAQDAEASQGAEAAAQDEQATQAAQAQAQAEDAYAGVSALASSVGIVEEVLPADDKGNPARIRVIQGDLEDKTKHADKVQRANYDRADKHILGYAEVPESKQALQDLMDAARLAASEAESQPAVQADAPDPDSAPSADAASSEGSSQPDAVADANADVETEEDWKKTLPSELTNSWPNDVVAVAQSQVDYAESQQNCVADESGVTKGYTRYGEWAGDPYADWSVPFVAFCLHYAGADEYPVELTCSEWLEALQSEEYGLYHPVESEYTPKPGDVVFFAKEEDADKVAAAYAEVTALADHVGIVEELLPADQNNPDRIRVIQGDVEDAESHADKVQSIEYERADASILGYAEVPENAEALQKIVEARMAAGETQGQNDNQITQTFEGEGYTVKAVYGPEAQLPENAELRATEYAKDSQHYQDRYAEAAAQYGWEAGPADGIRLFDVGFYVGDKEVEPAAPVKVTISCDGQQQDITYEIVHFGDELETVQAETTNNDNGQDVSFTLDSFSEVFMKPQVLNAGDANRTQINARDVSGSEPSITALKTIDAFRDGVDNPDTNLDNIANENQKKDLYRLYLDAQLSAEATPVDLLIVVDQSGSMHYNYGSPDGKDMENYEGEMIYRDEAVRLILNGAYAEERNYTWDSHEQDLSSDEALWSDNQQFGLIYQFLQANNENRVAVIGFQGSKPFAYSDVKNVTSENYNEEAGFDENSITSPTANAVVGDNGQHDAEILVPWTKEPQYVGIKGIYANATNYSAGFLQADKLLDSADSAHKQVVLFISDGQPTCNITKGTNLWEDAYFRGGDGQYDDTFNTSNITDEYFDKLREHHPDVIINTIGILDSSKKDSDEAIANAISRLEGMATSGGGKSYNTTTTADLKKDLNEVMFDTVYSDLTVADTLSDYVEFHSTAPDFKITLTEAGGVKKTLYDDGQITPEGAGILDSRQPLVISGKTVTANFDSAYAPRPGATVTLSFNVKTTQHAYAAYKAYAETHPKAENKYGDESVEPNVDPSVGDSNTDYEGNVTSSGQPGFDSNKTATLTYTKGGEEQTVAYPHPVVQVNSGSDSPSLDPDPDAAVSYHKTIDAFRDGKGNNDTELDDAKDDKGNPIDKTDLYRLYLDAAVKGKESAVDLVIVVDESDSMGKPLEVLRENKRLKIRCRDEVVREILNGTSDKGAYEANPQLKEGGLIYNFLKMNEENRVAVVGFFGSTGGNDYQYLDNVEPLGANCDPDGWFSGKGNSDDLGFVNVKAKGLYPAGYTNYCAALMKAKDLFSSTSSNEKVMIFLSDGVPTIYYDNEGIRQGGGWGYASSEVTEPSKTNTQKYIRDVFLKDDATKDVHAYTIGIIPDSGLLQGLESLDPATLQYMATNGHGAYLPASNASELESALRKFVKCSKVSNLIIEDTLSTYVDYYMDQPDIKVTMSKADQEPITLWPCEVSEQGEYTNSAQLSKGVPIVESVKAEDVTDSKGNRTKRVTATFNSEYQLDPSCTYTLSFNVKASDKAYIEFADSGDKYLKNGAEVKGDKGTDYRDNNTSSEQSGFYSNAKATLKYKKSDDVDLTTVEYDNPVIQATSCDFVLEKTDDSKEKPSVLPGAAFDLYREALEGETGDSVAGLSELKKYVKVNIEDMVSDSNTGRIEFKDLVPTDMLPAGKYWLIEKQAPAGYTMLTQPISIELKHGTGSNGEIMGTTCKIVDCETFKDSNEKLAKVLDGKATIEEANGVEKTVPLLKVVNTRGFELPETGGGGVGAFLGVGAALMTCAGAGLAAKRRRGVRV
ncbi:SpaA isopeptide-forming pilin-related protein [Adlercreutzia sp. ZJ473]|uniref:DUF7604 domain-containing protein n=1 Tax=Adlercreutzia sp. ZJ473 TaxID=2722822 RepID=UPI0015579690|nr:SpaA isopeptide-forming pilin-related protein [Adlercreutzia sp. ZJ473]